MTSLKNLLMENDGFAADGTDFYHMTTGQAMRHARGINHGSMVLRGSKNSTYTVIGGLKHILPAIAAFRFDREFVQWAKSLRLPNGQPTLSAEYLDSKLGQPLDVRMGFMPDGSVAFPGPIGWVTGRPDVVKMLDTPISDMLRRGSMVATKAARLKHIAALGNFKVADNSMRRSADPLGLITADICGMVGLPTSNMRAARARGANPVGTMDHWYVMAMMSEWFSQHPTADPKLHENIRAAQQYAFHCFVQANPEYGALLLDTISLEWGLEDAIIVLKEFNPQNYSVRLDSGDLAAGTRWVRQQLDAAGLPHITIALSGGLRAANLASLVAEEVPFNAAGVGEYFKDGGERARDANKDLFEAPVNVEIVTKLSYSDDGQGQSFRHIKLSETPAKASRGGLIDRVRLLKKDHGDYQLLADVEVDNLRHPQEGRALQRPLTSLRLDTLKPRTFAEDTICIRPIVELLNGPVLKKVLLDDGTARSRFEAQFAWLSDDLKKVNGSHAGCPVGVEREHYLNWQRMVTNLQPVQRITA
ncbi:MAG: hypothetical protein WAX89_05085 [Alphaproteobacteria bacterium]